MPKWITVRPMGAIPERWPGEATPATRGRKAKIVITGANRGLGLHLAMHHASKGDHVTLACRNVRKGEVVAEALGLRYSGEVVCRELDIEDLRSVRRFAAEYVTEHADDPTCYRLVLNAGRMCTPYGRTPQGIETQLGIHVGHADLTRRMFPMLAGTSGSRVISVSSNVVNQAEIHWNDLYKVERLDAYGQGKLFHLAWLEQFADNAGPYGVIALAVNPGAARTGLTRSIPAEGWRLQRAAFRALSTVLGQSPAAGARYLIDASEWPEEELATTYMGASRVQQTRGPTEALPLPQTARDPATRLRVWDWTAERTGPWTWPMLPAVASIPRQRVGGVPVSGARPKLDA